MTSSSVTVWTSSSTSHAESLVARYLAANRDLANCYESLSLAGCNVEEMRQRIENAFNSLVALTMADSSLHVIAVVPIYEQNSKSRISELYKACSEIDHNITLHLIGLCSSLRRIFDPEEKPEESKTAQEEALVLLKDLGQLPSRFSFSFSLVEDYAANGAPIGFTLKSLSRYLALVQTALTQDYYSILSPTLISGHAGENISIGLSSLKFDKSAVINQILGLGFLAALDNVGINNRDVNLQAAAHTSETILRDISSHYPKLYEREIRPLYRENGKSQNQAVAEASRILDDDISEIKDSILKLLEDRNLSLPEKEGVLAMILGRDNENLTGIQFEHEGVILDDACDDPINLYVDSYNNFCRGTHWLPVRGDFQALKIPEWLDKNGKMEDAPENETAINPLPEIKRLKQEILNTTSFLRGKEEELKELQHSQSLREDISEIKKQWNKPSGRLADVEYKERPLEEKYEPSDSMKVPESVDLRKFFNPVRDQHTLGSCTSFAVVSMYEAMMNSKRVEGENSMSPAFLYYFSNVLKGKPQGGSNFFEQLEVLGKHGVCRDDLFAYDSDSLTSKPSQDAEEDAVKHRVVCAKQIPLADSEDKVETLRKNHHILTSALSEGYPIGISLKIYDNLGKTGPFVIHPDQAPEAKEDGWHAMVIVGYSEENNFYIVRNSWGEEFGDQGYCYVPTTYIDDPDYMNFACIITEITDGAKGETTEVPTTLANFGATESEIRVAAVRNAISKVRIELRNDQRLYSEYYKYYQKLMMHLTMPKVQKDIRNKAEIAQASHCIDVEKQKEELENSFVAKLKEYKKSLRYVILSLLVATIGLGVTWYYSQKTVYGIIALAAGGLCALTWLGYKWWVKLKRRQLQEELDEVASNARRQEEKLLETQIRYHVAGMWLSKFHKLLLELGNDYERLVSYNDTLREWQTHYSSNIGEIEQSEGQMFRTLDPSPLLRSFFHANREEIVKGIDLVEIFRTYTADIEQLNHTHESLRESVKNSIKRLFDDFNITKLLLGRRYSYLHPVELQKELTTLLAVGTPSFRNPGMNASPSMRFILADVPLEYKMEWESTIFPHFPMRPIDLRLSDPSHLLILTLHPVSHT